jgi:tetratricopeptide (TPR) repeat protein
MRLSSSLLALLVVMCVSASTSAQGAQPGQTEPREQPRFNEHYLDYGAGLYGAAGPSRLALCAHDDPGVAIPSCTRLLAGGLYPRSERADVHALRANAQTKQAEFDLALADYNEAISIEPSSALYFNARAWILATAPDDNVRHGPQAIADALAANELVPSNPKILDTLAAAYAENGEFEKAVDTQQSAIAALQPGDQGTIGGYGSRLDLYRKGIPFRMALRPER